MRRPGRRTRIVAGSGNGATVTTTRYLDAFGVHVELVTSAATQWNEYLMVGGSMVGVRFVQGTSVTLRYFHQHHLGSVAVITDATGAAVERNAYDPWGKRRFWSNGAGQFARSAPVYGSTWTIRKGNGRYANAAHQGCPHVSVSGRQLSRRNTRAPSLGANIIHKQFCVNGTCLHDITAIPCFVDYRRSMQGIDWSPPRAPPTGRGRQQGNARGYEIIYRSTFVTRQM